MTGATADATMNTGTSGEIPAGARDVGIPTAATQTAHGTDERDSGCVWMSGSNAIAAAISRTKTNAARRVPRI
ncbi:MAG: hypothetical protein ACXW19_01805 [Thermoanaerobaculia bacterium]